MRTSFLALTAAALVSFSTPGVAQDLSEEDIKRLALEAIMENPQVIMDAVALLREREEAEKAAAGAQALADNKETIMDVSNAPVMGNPDGDVTIVEFFDYNCGYCKRAAPAVKALLETDKNIRVIYREWPILSEGSVVAARASLAAQKQDKYEEFHWALMEMSRVDEASVLQKAEEIGLDMAQLKADMESEAVDEHLAVSQNISGALGFTGTPSFVIGEQLVPGFVPQETLERLVAEARAAQ